MVPNAATITAAPYGRPPRSKTVVIAGAGPTGMTTAIELAQRGIASTVLESRGRVGTRDGLFNVIPAFIDELARMDPSGGLVSQLSRSTRSTRSNRISGTEVDQVFGRLTVGPDPAIGRGDIDAVLESARPGTAPGSRAWGKIGIGDLENGLRSFAEQRYPDLIDVRYNTAVEGVRSLDEYAEAFIVGP
ncbi:MAG: NAD(P)-binding protein, partial [Thermoleophilia bacterium]|nr:NAD(P)-binding protein [Thermoleophilia bacterium]